MFPGPLETRGDPADDLAEILPGVADGHRTVARLSRNDADSRRIKGREFLDRRAQLTQSMIKRTPDFIVIGAMKSATTTLHEQLARQPGLFMSRPKEPNFFSDDAIYANGLDWYASLFRDARDEELCGESSTHYTKLPTYPRTVERMKRALPDVKLIYVMRHPIDRLISHYVHELTTGNLSANLSEAIDEMPELVDYGRYSMQLMPYLDAFGAENVLPIFFRRLVFHPQEEFERIGRFIGSGRPACWDPTLKPQNVGSARLRKSILREALVSAPLLTSLRQRLIPKPWTEPLKAFWRAKTDPPSLPPDLEARLRDLFDEDLEQLGDWLGIELNCERFREAVENRPLNWV
jgi:hypothetical protein